VTRPARRLGAALSAIVALLATLAGCAKREPPSGGPPDIDPPRAIQSAPDSGAAGVPVDATISLTFSEPMEPRSTGDAVALAPRVAIAKRQWHGRTLTVVLEQPLQANRTYTLFVGGTARDRHGNPMGAGKTVTFSTADSFPPGRIDGEIEGRGLAASAVALWCYDAGQTPDSTAQDFDAIGLADAEGRFRIDGLAVPATYVLWAFVDQNGNRSFEPEQDILARVDTSFALTRERPVGEGFRVTVVNPRAPGSVEGAVLDSLADSLGVVRVLAVSEADSTKRLSVDAEPRTGAFEVQLDVGAWWLRAYRDLDRNRTWDVGVEPASERLRLVIEPAAEIQAIRLRLRRAGEARD
jgi:hypothetical protein